MEAKEAPLQPLLLVDIDGVISLFGFPQQAPPAGAFHWIDGVPHFLSTAAARHLLELAAHYELVWASGWEEKADEYLPHLLGVPRGLPHLRFERPRGESAGGTRAGSENAGGTRTTRAHWKLAAIDAYAGLERPLAWLDDAFDDTCHAWAAARPGPTLLVATEPHVGLTARQAARLAQWARSPRAASRWQ